MSKKKITAPVHIGKLIRAKFDETPLTYEKFGQLILTTKQNVTNIFRKEDINTTRLWRICVALKYNFFDEFSAEEPLRSMRNAEVMELQAQINRLNERIEQQEKMINNLEHVKKSNDKLIAMLEEEKERYKTSGK
ncbi:MAG: hypothetical protein WCF67_02280 [Chitinophagaceae bacterium]